jgi:Zn-dependent protease
MPGAGRFLIGWAKPVPVNPYNLRNKNFDDILVTMAGPGMNLILAVGLMGLAQIGLMFHAAEFIFYCIVAAKLSLILCFFNLIPVPPLDGSHILRVITGMSHEAFANFARYGFIIVIVLLQIPMISEGLRLVRDYALLSCASLYSSSLRQITAQLIY